MSTPMKGRQEGQSHRRRCDQREREKKKEIDSMLLALKTEKGVTSQGRQMASRTWKRQVKQFSPYSPLNTLMLGP